jgi:hypothetical protein
MLSLCLRQLKSVRPGDAIRRRGRGDAASPAAGFGKEITRSVDVPRVRVRRKAPQDLRRQCSIANGAGKTGAAIA